MSFAALLAASAAGGADRGRAVAVEIHGALREILHEGRLEGRAALSSYTGRPDVYALGAMAGLDGEFVIVAGEAHVSRPDGKGGIRSTAVEKGDSAALFVGASVTSWRTRRLTKPLSLTALEELLRSEAGSRGLPAGGPFPVIIEGQVSRLQWHVADGSKLPPGPSTHEEHERTAVRGETKSEKVVLVGFYSDHHAGVFVHRGRRVHFHALLSGGRAAHVDDVTVSPGALLRLPRTESAVSAG